MKLKQSLIELMIVFTIIGVLAVVTISDYLNYVSRAKLVEVI